MHLLSLLLVVASLSPANVFLNSVPSQSNHVIVADGPEAPPTVNGVIRADGPEAPPTFA